MDPSQHWERKLKPVQVRVAPAHGLLKKFVKQAEREVAEHPDPAPYGRLDPGKRDLELVDRNSFGRRSAFLPVAASVAEP